MTELPTGWAEVALNDLGVWGSGGTPKAGHTAYYGGIIPFVKIGDLNEGRFATTAETLTDAGLAASAAKWVPASSLLIAMYGSIGKLGINTVPVTTNQAIAFLQPTVELTETDFVYWAIKRFRLELISLGQGGTQQNISQKLLRAFRIPLPPLAEQQRIVAKLDAFTARTTRARADLDRIPALAARYKLAVLAKAYNGELTAEWRAKNGVRKAQVASLQELCGSITDGDHQAPPKADSGVPFITIGAMNDGRLDLTRATRFVPRSYLDGLKAARVARRGDVLYSVTGSFGIPALVDTDEEFVFQRHIAIMKPLQARASGRFLSLMLGAPQVLQQAAEVATGTAQLTVPLTGLRKFQFTAPSLQEQDEIIRVVSRAFVEIDRMVMEAAAASLLLDRLEQAVVAKAFRGELVPQDPADEPASILLDRILAERAAAPRVKRGRRVAT